MIPSNINYSLFVITMAHYKQMYLGLLLLTKLSLFFAKKMSVICQNLVLPFRLLSTT